MSKKPKVQLEDNVGVKATERRTQRQPGSGSAQSRGSSVQGELQGAKGGPAGANQGGASRGGSRVEPSHQKRAAKKDRGSR